MKTPNIEVLKLFQSTSERVQKNEIGVVGYLMTDPHKMQVNLRKQIRKEDWGDRVQLVCGNDTLYVHVKPIPYVKRLESLLRQAMLHIDDEALYDTIMKTLEEKYDYTITKR